MTISQKNYTQKLLYSSTSNILKFKVYEIILSYSSAIEIQKTTAVLQNAFLLPYYARVIVLQSVYKIPFLADT